MAMLRIMGLAAAAVAAALVAPSGASATVVSLTFDDGYASQYTAARPLLASHGMHGTFFIPSKRIGSSTYMSWQQVTALAADGNEIGGHTLDHKNLTTVSAAEARRQVCTDRNVLLAHEFAVTDFAYPYGAFNSAVESVVAACGYNSARTTAWYGTACSSPCTESIPPRDNFATTIVGFGGDQAAPDLERIVTTAESYGGWAQILIHRVCDDCGAGAMRPADLDTFLSWLAPRAARGTVVETVAQVIGGGLAPPVSPDGTATIPAAPGTPTGVAGVDDVVVSWEAPAQDGGSHILGYTVTATPGGATCSSDSALSCTVEGLTPGDQYTFTVRARNSVGAGVLSPTSTPVAPLAPPPIATAPTAPRRATAVAGVGRVRVTWKRPLSDGGAVITAYTVRGLPGGATCTTRQTLSCTVKGLWPGRAYRFTVTASNSAGMSRASRPSRRVTPRCVRRRNGRC
jgi:peptidoglycan/xylan/chitin deacetylase (PgdA/CDA1 family)